MPTPAQVVRQYLVELQQRIVGALETFDGTSFRSDAWTRTGGGSGITRVIEDGHFFERGGVNFSHVQGQTLPASASASRPELAGSAYEAMGVSLVLHPRNPYCPTVHLNVRFFVATPGGDSAEDEAVTTAPKFLASPLGASNVRTAADDAAMPAPAIDRTKPTWWFGGGMDMTPYYPFEEDVRHFHRVCQQALAPFGPELYPRYKAWCDQYFFIKHRNEARGVGGLFFDDLNAGSFERCFDIAAAVGDAFIDAYLPIVLRRRKLSYGERERSFQAYRRGRYVEFNLVHDRGTLFGLQSGGRAESILMSMPPSAAWRYDWHPEPGSPEAKLYEEFLPPRDWV